MESNSTVSTKLAFVLLAALLAANVYRAATQSMTIDEAITYNNFVAEPFLKSIQYYDANNHVLYSILCRISVAVFGLSHLSVRLPSLLAGLLYFVCVYRLSREAFGHGWRFLLAVALLSMNPFLLDHLSLARGYGLATALLTWMLYALWRGRLLMAGIAMGLCLAANAVFLFPVAALLVAYVLVRPGDVWNLAERTAIPAGAIAFSLMLVPFSHASPASFYYGATKLNVTASVLAAHSFFHHETRPIFWGFEPNLPLMQYRLDKIAIYPVAAALLFIAVMWERSFARARQGNGAGKTTSLLLLAGGCLVFTVLLVYAARAQFGTLYPMARTSLYAVPLFTIAGLTATFELRGRWWRRAALGVACLCAVQYALELNATHYVEWPVDAGIKDAVAYIRNDAGLRNVRLGSSWILTPSLTFYRTLNRQWNWNELSDKPFSGRFDYLVLANADIAEAARRGLTVVHRAGELVVVR